MTEETQEEDVKVPETVEPEAEVEKSSKEEEAPTEGSREYNWRALERKVSELERRNEELSRPAIAKEEFHLDKDDLITVEQADERAKKIFEQEQAKRDRSRLPEATKSKYKDYDSVVTPENIERLIKEDPDLEHDISVAKNPFARAYKAIKQAEFYKSNSTTKEANVRITGNEAKPVSGNAVGKASPLDQANAFATDAEAAYREMQKYRGGSI